MNTKQENTFKALKMFCAYRRDITEVKQTNTLYNGRPIVSIRYKGAGSVRYEVFFELNEKGDPVKASGYEFHGCCLDMPFRVATDHSRALCSMARHFVDALTEKAKAAKAA